MEAGAADADIDVVAATCGPGLVGSLLVGVAAAKALALVWDVPYIGVNHHEAHLYAALLDEHDAEVQFPLVTLLVSGGHTMLISFEGHGRYRLLGATRDDAAGEAFDKVARYLGLGYPGGPVIDRLAAEGDPFAVAAHQSHARRRLRLLLLGHQDCRDQLGAGQPPRVATADVAASFQACVVDVLTHKTRKAAQQTGAAGICLAGGVAANSALRERTLDICMEDGINAYLPSRAMCTDNAAMIAATAWYRLNSDGPSNLDGGADPNLRIDLPQLMSRFVAPAKSPVRFRQMPHNAS